MSTSYLPWDIRSYGSKTNETVSYPHDNNKSPTAYRFQMPFSPTAASASSESAAQQREASLSVVVIVPPLSERIQKLSLLTPDPSTDTHAVTTATLTTTLRDSSTLYQISNEGNVRPKNPIAVIKSAAEFLINKLPGVKQGASNAPLGGAAAAGIINRPLNLDQNRKDILPLICDAGKEWIKHLFDVKFFLTVGDFTIDNLRKAHQRLLLCNKPALMWLLDISMMTLESTGKLITISEWITLFQLPASSPFVWLKEFGYSFTFHAIYPKVCAASAIANRYGLRWDDFRGTRRDNPRFYDDDILCVTDIPTFYHMHALQFNIATEVSHGLFKREHFVHMAFHGAWSYNQCVTLGLDKTMLEEPYGPFALDRKMLQYLNWLDCQEFPDLTEEDEVMLTEILDSNESIRQTTVEMSD